MFTITKKINFFHCDPAGVIFYARLFEICHSAYEEMVSDFKLNENYWNNEDYAVPIVKCDAGFFKPVKPGDEVTVELAVTELLETTFELSYTIKNSKGVEVASAKTVHVFVNKKLWKGKVINESVRNGLSKYLKS